jgi:hypothetical protein
VCFESCHLLAGESPTMVTGRRSRGRLPVLPDDRWCRNRVSSWGCRAIHLPLARRQW